MSSQSIWGRAIISPLTNKICEAIESRYGKRVEISPKPPPREEFGDLSVNMFEVSKVTGLQPKRIAEEIYHDLPDFLPLMEATQIGPYINFKLNTPEFAKLVIPEVLSKGYRYGFTDEDSGSFVIVEHTSANPLHPLHCGHLRNSILGDVLARLLRAIGRKVEVHYLINDMGRQVAILLLGYLKREDKALPEDVKHDIYVGELYVEANRMVEKDESLEREVDSLLKRMESGDPEIKDLLDKIVDYCIEGQMETLKRLGISFDIYTKESRLCWSGQVSNVVKKLLRTKYAKQDPEGAVYLDLGEFGIDVPFYLLRSNGTTLYGVRDVAYSIYKLERGAERVYNVIGSEQSLEQRQVRKALEILGYKNVEDKLVHVGYDVVRTPEFGSMSGRKGEFIAVDFIIDEAKKRAYKSISKSDISENEKDVISETVAISAIKFSMLNTPLNKVINFRLNEALNLKANSGPYILYTLTRARSILRKSGERMIDTSSINYSYLDGDVEKRLLIDMSRLPAIFREVTNNLTPNVLTKYTLRIADNFNKFYETKPVLNAPEGEDASLARLSLVKAVDIVLTNILKIIGVQPLEKM